MSIFKKPTEENPKLFKEDTCKLHELPLKNLFRIPGAGTYEQATGEVGKDHGTFFLVIPTVPKNSQKVTVVSIDAEGNVGEPQVFPGVIQVIPHKFQIEVEPAKRVPLELVEE